MPEIMWLECRKDGNVGVQGRKGIRGWLKGDFLFQ